MGGARARRSTLRKLLESGVTGTQGELCERLADLGHATTQSTVSRDLKLLGAQRTLRGDGSFAYHLRTSARGPFPTEMVNAIDHNETIVVIKTKVGRAQAVGFELDAVADPDILGTLAGDDTVLVIPRSANATIRLVSRLRELTGLSG